MSRFLIIRAVDHPVVEFHAPSLVRLEFAADADINNLVRKFLRTGVIDMPNANRSTIVDATDMPGDFSESAEMAFNQFNESSNSASESNPDFSSQSAENGSSPAENGLPGTSDENGSE